MISRIRYNKEGETLVSRTPVLIGHQALLVTIDNTTGVVVFSDANTDEQLSTVQGEVGTNLKLLAKQTLKEMGAVFQVEKRNRNKAQLTLVKTGTEF